MSGRIEEELKLLRKRYSNSEWHPNDKGGWILLPNFSLPNRMWSKRTVDICFEIKDSYPATAPYSFYVKDGIQLKNGNTVGAYTTTKETPFGGTWGKFSWQHDNAWRPTGDLVSGSNITNFVSSFSQRFKDLS